MRIIQKKRRKRKAIGFQLTILTGNHKYSSTRGSMLKKKREENTPKNSLRPKALMSLRATSAATCELQKET